MHPAARKIPLLAASAAALFFILSSPAALRGGEEDKPAAKKAEGEGEASTHTVTGDPFRVVTSLDGVFEATLMEEVSLAPEEWEALVVISALPQGRPVEKGDRLVELETEKIDQAISDLERSQAAGAIAVATAEKDLEVLGQSTPLDLAAAERAKKIADDDLLYFLKVARPMREKSVAQSLENSVQNLEYQEEELRQLRKMYEADDLTEETEEIILKRAENAVKRARFFLEQAKLNTRKTLEVDLPRQQVEMEEAARRQSLARERAGTVLPNTLQQKRLELAKLKEEHARGAEKLRGLKADRAAMAVLSPAAGLVYYGQCVRGRWSTAVALEKKLRPGGRLAAHEVFMTVVSPGAMVLRATVPEDRRAFLAPGTAGSATAVAWPGTRLPVELAQISVVPVPGGGFDAVLRIGRDGLGGIVPGMAGKIELLAYEREDALAVPRKAVFDEGPASAARYVFVRGPDGEPERRDVVTGAVDGDRVEVTEGLGEGEEILLQRPE